MKKSLNHSVSLLALGVVSAFGVAGHAQAQATPKFGDTDTTKLNAARPQTSLQLEEVVVTASTGTKKKIRSSLSVTNVSTAQIAALAPQSQAEVLRLIPGLIVGDTAGAGGNSNLSVRGLPITTGGSPFVQLQEDGLPGVLFGDMNFGNNDYWIRFDQSNSVEAVRGGSVSTLASQAPGAVINYISQVGARPGGAVAVTQGLNYDTTKLDFDYGGKIDDTLRYHFDGFGITGSGGLRSEGYRIQRGYQIKGNVTKDLPDGHGYVRLYVKSLDDREPTNTSYPVITSLSGNSISDLSKFPGFDARDQTNMGIYNRHFDIVDVGGDLHSIDATGIHPVAEAVGTKIHYIVNDQLSFDDNFRKTWMSGTFATNFLSLTPTSSVLGSLVNGGVDPTKFPVSAGYGGIVSSIRYANGPNAGQEYTKPYLNTNVNIYTNMRDMGNVGNDASLEYKQPLPVGKLDFKAGVFYFDQTIAQDWHPNQNFSEISGKNPAELNLFTATGQQLTVNGQSGYNTNWGQSVDRDYNMDVQDTAPYMDLSYDWGGLDLEASARFDRVHVNGWAESASDATTSLTNVGGVLIPTYNIDPNTRENLDYNVNYTSWSFGALYAFNPNLSVFARGSKGGKVNTDRNILSGYTNPDGSLNASGRSNALDTIYQEEVGVKSRTYLGDAIIGVNLTGFHNNFGASNFDLTNTSGGPNGTFFNAQYESYGVEFEGSVVYGDLTVNSNVTYTDAKLEKNEIGGSPSTLIAQASGFEPPGTSKWVFLVAPTYTFGPVQAGVVVQGQADTNLSSTSAFYGPTQVFVDAFVKYNITEHLALSANVNNLLNAFGVNNSVNNLQSGAIAAAAENGRSGSVTLAYRF